MLLGGVIVLAALVVVMSLSFLINAPIDDPTGHSNLAYHAHVKLTIHDIRVNQSLPIPAIIGVPGGIWVTHTLDSMGGVYAPLHTHDDSGTIHIEPKAFFVFTLGNFFDIWGKPLSTTCVWDYCAGPGRGPPIMATKSNDWLEGFVDRDYLLRNDDEILILIGAG